MQFLCLFPDITKLAHFWRKKAELKGCVAFITYFCIFFRSGMTMSSFILLRYVQQILGRVEGLLGSKSSEKVHLIRVLLPVTYKKLFGKVLPNWLFLVPMLKGCFHYFFASWFCKSKGEHLWNKEKCFLFHFRSSFRSWDNQILTFEIFKYHDVIKFPSIKHETHFTELGK